jgi:hypothetical protein
MKTIDLGYDQFKTLVSSKILLGQYKESSDKYELFAVEANVSWETCILKASDDGIDFETNWKSNYNKPLEYRSEDGLQKVASAKFVDALTFFVDGENGHLDIADGQTAYLKYNSNQEYALAGMDVYWFGANWGDYVDCEAGVYPHGDSTNEADFYVIEKFGNKYRIYKDGSRIFDILTVKKVPATINLGAGDILVYVRIKYVNAGGGAAKCIFNIVGWK